MKRIRVIARCAALAAAVLATLGAGPARADSVPPLIIPPGLQLLHVLPGSFIVVSLPAGSLGLLNGQPSDPLTDVIINSFGVGGSSSGTQSPLQFDTPIESTSFNHSKIDYDYKVQKENQAPTPDATLKWDVRINLFNIGNTDTVPIEIVSLSLMSVQPVTINYGNGAFSSFFDVFVELDPASTQQPGSLTLVRVGSTTGTYQLTLPVTYRLTFINTNPALTTLGGSFVFTDTFNASGSFQVVPEPGSLALVALGVAGIFARRARTSLGGKTAK
jgi:hypothetical protein